jgi:hypothetical protein
MEETMLDSNKEKVQGKKMIAAVIFGILTVATFAFYCVFGISAIKLLGVESLDALGLIILIPVMFGLLFLTNVFGIIWQIISVILLKKGTAKIKIYAKIFVSLSILILVATWAIFATLMIKNGMNVASENTNTAFINCLSMGQFI